YDDYNVALETQVSILRSDQLALKVIQALHLDQNATFLGTKTAGGQPAPSVLLSKIEPDEKKVTSLLAAFSRGLNVRVMPQTRLINLHYMHSDPRLAAQIVNTSVKTFIEENFRTKYVAAMQT